MKTTQFGRMGVAMCIGAATAIVLATGGISMRRGLADTAKEARGLITIDVLEADLGDVLRMLSVQSGINIIYTGDVKGKMVTAQLNNMTLEEALKSIVEANGFYYRKDKDVYVVTKEPPRDLAGAAQSSSPPAGQGAREREKEKSQKYPPELLEEESSEAPVRSKPKTVPRYEAEQEGAAVTDRPPVRPVKKTYKVIPIRYSRSRDVARYFNPDVGMSNEELITGGILSAMSGTVTGLNSAQGGRSSSFGAQQVFLPPALGGMGNTGIVPYGRSARAAQFPGGGGGLGGGGGRGGGLGGGGLGGGGGGGGGGGMLDLPDGIDQIVSYDPLNYLIVYGDPAKFEELETLISMVDKPFKQVIIEAQFVDLTTGEDRTLGIDWDLTNGATQVIVSGINPGGNIAVTYARGNFTARLNAMLLTNRAKLVAAPRIATMNNLPAFLMNMSERPFFLTQVTFDQFGNPITSVEAFSAPVMTFLIVTPTIHDDGTVTVYLQPNIADVVGSVTAPGGGGAVPIVVNRMVTSVLNVKDGETIAIGGLVRKSESQDIKKVPLLSGLPIVGQLFQGKSISRSDTETIIFMTPRVMHREVEEETL